MKDIIGTENVLNLKDVSFDENDFQVDDLELFPEDPNAINDQSLQE